MRARAVLASALLAALVLAGCASDADDQATGATRTIYVSVPLHGANAGPGRAIVNGAKLALADAGGEAGGMDVEAIYLDDTSGSGRKARWDPVIVADNARRAAQDTSAIAYIGELESGATRTSLPITNQAMMLQVSPGSAAVDLVEGPLGPGDYPDLAQPTGERTFGRVIPEDEVQAAAGAKWAKELGSKRVLIAGDGSAFGKVIADAFKQEGSTLGLRVSTSPLAKTQARCGTSRVAGKLPPPSLVYLAGETVTQSALSCFSAVLLANRIMASDALLNRAGIEALASNAYLNDTYLTSAAQDPKQLPPSGQRFVREYQREFGESPERYAAYGYEAMAVVLDSIERAAQSDDRSDVIDAFFATEDRDSILGTYSIDDLGNTTLRAISGYRVENGRPVFDTALTAP